MNQKKLFKTLIIIGVFMFLSMILVSGKEIGLHTRSDDGSAIVTGTFDWNFTGYNNSACSGNKFFQIQNASVTSDFAGLNAFELNITNTSINYSMLYIQVHKDNSLVGCKKWLPPPKSAGLIVEENLNMGDVWNITNINAIKNSSEPFKLIGDEIQIWNPAEGANDYFAVSHDGSNTVFRSGSGFIKTQDDINPSSANNRLLGSTTFEWRGMYIGEGHGLGITFGVDQDVQFYFNDSDMILNSTANETHIITPALKVWDDLMGANDNVQLYHDGTTGQVYTPAGTLGLGVGVAPGAWQIDSSAIFKPDASNSRFIGSTTREVKAIYLGEASTSSGLIFGLDQDHNLYHNGSDMILNSTANQTHIITPALKIWDDVMAANDFLSLSHSGTQSVIDSGSGAVAFADKIVPTGANSIDIGSTSLEWQALFMGEGQAKGIIFGSNQDHQLYHNGSDMMLNVSANDTNVFTRSFKIWDEAGGANDYIDFAVGTANIIINSQVGDWFMRRGGTNILILTSNEVKPGSANTQLGDASNAWNGFFIGDEEGIQIGFDEDIMMNYTSATDALQFGGWNDTQTINFTKTNLTFENGARMEYNSTCLILVSPDKSTNVSVCNA